MKPRRPFEAVNIGCDNIQRCIGRVAKAVGDYFYVTGPGFGRQVTRRQILRVWRKKPKRVAIEGWFPLFRDRSIGYTSEEQCDFANRGKANYHKPVRLREVLDPPKAAKE